MQPSGKKAKQEVYDWIIDNLYFMFWTWPLKKIQGDFSSWIWAILKGSVLSSVFWVISFIFGYVYSKQDNQQQLLNSLLEKLSKAEKLLVNDLYTKTYDELVERVSKSREDLPKFIPTLSGVQQYYRQCKNSKIDEELLDNLEKEIDNFLAKLETVRRRKEIQSEVAMAVQAIASSSHCVNSEPNGPKPLYSVTAFSVEAYNGELILKWKDEKNDDCIRYDIKLCDDLGIDRLYDVKPYIKFCSLNDRAIKNWKTYTVAVRPVNNSGAGPYCKSIECLNATIPSIPSCLKIVNPTSNTSVKLSCLCPQIEDVTACIVKGVTVDDIEVPIVERNGELATIEVKGLCDANAEFDVKLKFQNKYGDSENYSQPLKVKMSDFIPKPPDNFVLSPVSEIEDIVYLKWKKPSRFVGTIESYEIERADKDRFEWTSLVIVPASKLSYDIPFALGTYYRVSSISTFGCKSNTTDEIKVTNLTPKWFWTLFRVLNLVLCYIILAVTLCFIKLLYFLQYNTVTGLLGYNMILFWRPKLKSHVGWTPKWFWMLFLVLKVVLCYIILAVVLYYIYSLCHTEMLVQLIFIKLALYRKQHKIYLNSNIFFSSQSVSEKYDDHDILSARFMTNR